MWNKIIVGILGYDAVGLVGSYKHFGGTYRLDLPINLIFLHRIRHERAGEKKTKSSVLFNILSVNAMECTY